MANQYRDRKARDQPGQPDHRKQQAHVTRIAEQEQRLNGDHRRQQRARTGFDGKQGREYLRARALLSDLQPKRVSDVHAKPPFANPDTTGLLTNFCAAQLNFSNRLDRKMRLKSHPDTFFSIGSGARSV
jgi:hypothetical protein